MKVILLDKVKGLGEKDAVVNASEGYVRNFLVPRGLAVEATPAEMKKLDKKKANEAHKEEENKKEAQALKARLEKTMVTINTKAGDAGRLFGSITNKDIATVLKNEHEIVIDKRKIELSDTIKQLGTYEAVVKVYPNIAAKLRIQVKEQ